MKINKDMKIKLAIAGETQVSLAQHFHCSQATIQYLLAHRNKEYMSLRNGLRVYRKDIMDYLESKIG